MPQLTPEVFATRFSDPPYYPYLNLLSLFGYITPILFLISVFIAIFLFIDSRNHKRNFIIWPLLALILNFGSILILIIYLATKGRSEIEYEEEEQNMGQGIKRAYFYIFSFITLGILFFGVADLIRVILDFNLLGSQTENFGRSYLHTRDSFTRNVSFRLATIIVALPIWFFHWMHLEDNLPKIQDPYELKITFRTYKSYLYLVSGISLAVIIIFGIWFVYQLLNLLLGVSNIKLGSFAAPIGYTITSLAIFAYHFLALKSEKFQQIEQKVISHPVQKIQKSQDEKTIQQKQTDKFCPKCGIKNSPNSNYCVSCGTKL